MCTKLKVFLGDYFYVTHLSSSLITCLPNAHISHTSPSIPAQTQIPVLLTKRCCLPCPTQINYFAQLRLQQQQQQQHHHLPAHQLSCGACKIRIPSP